MFNGLTPHDRHGVSGGATVRSTEPPDRPAPFESNDALVEGARQMFHARRLLAEVEQDASRRADADRVSDNEATWTDYWHESFDMTGDGVVICEQCRKHGLSRTEREILIALVLDRLALLETGVRTCGDVLGVLGLSGPQVIQSLRSLSEHGRLHKAGLISYDDPDEDLRERRIVVDPTLVETVLYDQAARERGWPVKTEEELYDRLRTLSRGFMKKVQAVEYAEDALPGHNSDIYRTYRRVDRLVTGLEETLELHPDWRLQKLLTHAADICRAERLIILILVGKELSHLNSDHSLFTGLGLARAACDQAWQVRFGFAMLQSKSTLVREDLIRPAGGEGDLLTDDPRALAEVEFELTGKSLDILKIERRLAKEPLGAKGIRKAKVRMEQLVLSEEVHRALQMAIAQARNADVLIRDWGLGEVMPYGRAVTLLFSGPPGVGKTACAEALAHELERPILVADYSQIQNCFVGQTEKNIVKMFRAARAHEAVLFWDEADAMFYDREMAARSWEVRDVNVLLQELERFDGVCILATNRKVSLDKALERRISLKVEFDRPDREMRWEIWQRLIPPKMPLSDDVDLDKLSAFDLTGGEIRNVVLNAARLSLSRTGSASVTMRDIQRAIEMETSGTWRAEGTHGIGFAHSNRAERLVAANGQGQCRSSSQDS